eukprot:scaffold12278_cov69-Cyclotella_meneghiniana.AAC.2
MKVSVLISGAAMSINGTAAFTFAKGGTAITIRAIEANRSALHAKPSGKSKRQTNSGTSRGFGKPTPQQNIDNMVNKSYGLTVIEQSNEEAQEAMDHFFSTHDEWRPLFNCIMSSTMPPAHTHLSHHDSTDNIWDTNNQYPWSILPATPSDDSSLSTISLFLDEWQRSLTDIPMDAFKNVEGGYDTHFLEEGRRTIAVSRFHVVNPAVEEEEWESQLFRLCWSELGYLMRQDEADTGSLILLPQGLRDSDGGGSFKHVQRIVTEKLIRPMQWLGRGEDVEIVAMERGTVGVRLLYKLGEIPDLSEKYQMNEGDSIEG